MVVSPSTYPELNVWENLEIDRRLHGIPDKKATSRVIERLGIHSYLMVLLVFIGGVTATFAW